MVSSIEVGSFKKKIEARDRETEIHARMDRLRGRLCGLIESWGLEEKQERACIATLKQMTYDSEADFVDLLNE